jgi:hypothetical protein
MRFKHAEQAEQAEQTKKTVRHFAVLPLRLNNETRWLEVVEVDYVWLNKWEGWVPIRFTDQAAQPAPYGYYEDGGQAKPIPPIPEAMRQELGMLEHKPPPPVPNGWRPI